MKALIFASGGGTRFGKLTENKPKALLPLSGTPLIGWILKGLEVVGVNHAYITLGYQGQEIPKEIGDNYGKIKITYLENKKWKLGNLQSLLVARDYFFDIGNRFWIDIDTRADASLYFARKYKDIFPHFEV